MCIAFYINQHWRDLDLSGDALGDEGIQVLYEGLKHSAVNYSPCEDQESLCSRLHMKGLANRKLGIKLSSFFSSRIGKVG